MARNTATETVTCAYPHSQTATMRFTNSLLPLVLINGHRFNRQAPFIVRQCTDIAQGRNKIVEAFLDHSDADWLWFVDTDQTFPPDILERMVASADPVERPILSALVMARREPPHPPVSPACVLYHDALGTFVAPKVVPKETHWQVGATGSGCVLIHRTVLEAMREAHGEDAWPWFKYAQHNRTLPDGTVVPDVMGEDYVFSLRAAALGFSCWVDTTIEAGHIKEQDLRAADFFAQLPAEQRPRKTLAVIPVKGKRKMTADLLKQLSAENLDGILVVDNGSPKEMRNWLSTQQYAEVVEAPGVGIHHMWNMGVEWAAEQSLAGYDLLFLNNDLSIGEGMVDKLAGALRSSQGQLVAVCPNYDGRPGEGVELVNDTCGNRYDGTGGLAGFAFMVRGEWFATGWRFPEQCMWWFGDDDLVLSVGNQMQQFGHPGCAVVLDATVEHLDGGSQTGDWMDPVMQEQLKRDRDAFAALWEARRKS